MFNYIFIRSLIGRIVLFMAFMMLVPIITSLIFHDGTTSVFLIIMCFFVFIGLSFTYWDKTNIVVKLRVHDLFFSTTLVWILISILCSIPYIAIMNMSLVDALFETVSGITTTGSTVLNYIELMPKSIIIWRSMTQWIGGIGFIVISIAIFPNVNIGGMGLFKTESSDTSDKQFAHSRDVGKSIMIFYILLTLLCFIFYIIARIPVWDAINLTFSTVSTGGFAPTDEGFYIYNDFAQWVAIVFMFISSLPLVMLVNNIYMRKPWRIFLDSQLYVFLLLVIIFVLSSTIILYFKGTFVNFSDTLRMVTFNIVNIISTAGYTNGDFDIWSTYTTVIFILCFIIGGCSGSTSSGLKIFRLQILFKFILNQFSKSFNNNSIQHIRYNGRVVSQDTIMSIFTFLALYLFTLAIIIILLSLTGLDLISSLSGAITSLSNVGPGLGEMIGPSGNFADVSNAGKIILSASMLLGRLEITTLLILLLPRFWRY